MIQADIYSQFSIGYCVSIHRNDKGAYIYSDISIGPGFLSYGWDPKWFPELFVGLNMTSCFHEPGSHGQRLNIWVHRIEKVREKLFIHRPNVFQACTVLYCM